MLSEGALVGCAVVQRPQCSAKTFLRRSGGLARRGRVPHEVPRVAAHALKGLRRGLLGLGYAELLRRLLPPRVVRLVGAFTSGPLSWPDARYSLARQISRHSVVPRVVPLVAALALEGLRRLWRGTGPGSPGLQWVPGIVIAVGGEHVLPLIWRQLAVIPCNNDEILRVDTCELRGLSDESQSLMVKLERAGVAKVLVCCMLELIQGLRERHLNSQTPVTNQSIQKHHGKVE
mmetsp:Transcript_9341/g.20803  ORF Transcript_9341/g.20803 Transcript_9341/m.20803 type:complete len:232 (+) Transcript_9341:295-990(+)